MADDIEKDWESAPITATHWCECRSKWIDDTMDTHSDCCTPIACIAEKVEHENDLSKHLVGIVESVECPAVGYSYMCGFNDAKRKIIDVIKKR